MCGYSTLLDYQQQGNLHGTDSLTILSFLLTRILPKWSAPVRGVSFPKQHNADDDVIPNFFPLDFFEFNRPIRAPL